MRLVALVLAGLFALLAARAENPLAPVYQKLCDGGDAVYCQTLGNIFNEGRDVPVVKARAAAASVAAWNGGASTACRYAAAS